MVFGVIIHYYYNKQSEKDSYQTIKRVEKDKAIEWEASIVFIEKEKSLQILLFLISSQSSLFYKSLFDKSY